MNNNDQNRGIGFSPGNKSVMAPGGKDIAHIAYRPPKRELPDPPITRRIRLPEIVSVRYLAEILAETTRTPFWTMVSQVSGHVGVSVDRSISFRDAARVLRKYGIAATELER
jgi:hypothetical protein